MPPVAHVHEYSVPCSEMLPEVKRVAMTAMGMIHNRRKKLLSLFKSVSG